MQSVAAFRTSRPSPALIEDVLVEYYGSKLPLKQVAAISVTPPNVLIVQPWDKNAIQPIEKAIAQSNLGTSPAVDGDVVRITLPPLTEERRRNLVKVLSGEAEKTKIAFRVARDEVRKKIQEAFNKKEIGEDQKFKLNELLQKEVDQFNETLEDLVSKKEKEIMEG
ncbi:MAG: ribosome recycling factor [Parcubacteria group bacterium]|nr:ribosome recycling factor [Parcubacteria group bacterium]